jgi:predicted molibdopterin-dependent oxidoreductase YjgC
MNRPVPAPADVTIRVDERVLRVEAGITVAAALQNAGLGFRRSVTGEVRGPLCGMGICHECRVTIGGVAHRRACLVMVEPGMEIRTGV